MADKAETRSKTAIVTGGSRGLGRGVVLALAARGLDVIALARDAQGLAALARELENVHPVVADAATYGSLFCRLFKKGLNPPNRLIPAIKSV